MSQCITVAINYVDFKDDFKRENQQRAIDVLLRRRLPNTHLVSINFQYDKIDLPPVFHISRSLTRDSEREIGNWRSMPYVKEIFNQARRSCPIFGYMNSDILIPKGFFKVFGRGADAYIFSRIDIEPLSIDDFMRGNLKICENVYTDGRHDGVDAFFFTSKWWKSNNRFFHDDLVLGEPFWDLYYRHVIKRHSDNYVELHNLYHVFHKIIWRNESPGGSRNEAIWKHYRSTIGE